MIPASEVLIRPYRESDVPAAWDAICESRTALERWMPWCHSSYSIDDCRSWIEAQIPAFARGTAFEFAIVSPDDGYMGGCGLNRLDPLNRRANLGYWVRTSAIRRGVATRAVRELRDWAFEHTPLIRLEVVVAVGNVASEGVATRAGATREGVLRSRLLLHGVVHDAIMFSFVGAECPGDDR